MTNEEKYKTPEERQEAFETFCESQRLDNMPCSKCCELRNHKGKASCEYLWLALEAEEEKPCAKEVEPPDDTVVWVVYRDRNGLVTYKDRTWLGNVLIENGPRQVAITLYEDHTAYGDTSPGYIKPVAWFYTEMEALNYIARTTTRKGF